MRRLFLIFATALCLPSFFGATLNAADEAFPSSLLGFIKPGMQLGVRSSRMDSLVTIEIYRDEQFRILRDARDMSLEDLGKKYPQIADKAAKALAEFTSSLEAQRTRTPQVANFPPSGKPTVSLAVDREVLLCTVLYVGDDYFLVTYGDDNSKRQVIAKHAVTRMRWASADVRFRTSISN